MFFVLEYILLITIDPFFYLLSINCIIYLFRGSPLFVYTYFIRVPARKAPQRFSYCCTAAGMVQSEGENADKIRLHLFYWGNVRRFFNHEKEIGCARRSGIHCRHSSQRMRRFQGRRHEKQLCRLEAGKRRKDYCRLQSRFRYGYRRTSACQQCQEVCRPDPGHRKQTRG